MSKGFAALWLKTARRLVKAQAAQQKSMRKALAASSARTVKRSLETASKTAANAAVKAAAKTRVKTAGKAAAAKKSTAALPSNTAPSAISKAASNAASASPASTRAARAAPPAGGSWTRSFHRWQRGPEDGPDGAPSTARRLTYWLYLPPVAATPAVNLAAPPAAALPLVIMLHGCDQSAADFAAGTRMNRLAARHGFAVCYPQQSASAHPQRCWPWYERSLQQGGGEVALVASLARMLIARHGFDRSRVYVAGLSAGAALAQALALRHPDLIAALGSHSGPAFGLADSRMRAFGVMQHGGSRAETPIAALLRARPDFPELPAMILQGDQDHVVRPVNAQRLAQQFLALNRLSDNAVLAVHERPARGACDAYRLTDHGRGRRVLVRVCDVAHLAHGWSGGDAAWRYNAARGPDASALLWAFFRRHRRLPPRQDALETSQGEID